MTKRRNASQMCAFLMQQRHPLQTLLCGSLSRCHCLLSLGLVCIRVDYHTQNIPPIRSLALFIHGLLSSSEKKEKIKQVLQIY